jgi:hypothetical protein
MLGNIAAVTFFNFSLFGSLRRSWFGCLRLQRWTPLASGAQGDGETIKTLKILWLNRAKIPSHATDGLWLEFFQRPYG